MQYDPRFPQQNQTLNCFINYVDYHRCQELLPGDSRCEYFKEVVGVMCPNAWVARWDQQREKGTFPHKIIKVPENYCELLEEKNQKK